MLNCTLTAPLIVLFRVILQLVRYKAWNCLYPAIEYFNAPILITIP
jgi:hypothetical protein